MGCEGERGSGDGWKTVTKQMEKLGEAVCVTSWGKVPKTEGEEAKRGSKRNAENVKILYLYKKYIQSSERCLKACVVVFIRLVPLTLSCDHYMLKNILNKICII